MAESKKLVTINHRLHVARQILESVSEPANTAYYVFFGNHLDYANNDVIPQPVDSVNEIVDVYNNMIFGKRLTSNDLKLMIPRNNYTSNKVYDMYDDMDGAANVSLFNSNYYAVVNAEAYYHVFKCLENNNGSNSTVQPEFSEIDAADEVYQTSDGYVWKYMYSVDSSTVAKFATTEYFPVVPNTTVQNSAVEGVINVIKVENSGRGYDNYCNGSFRSDDLRVDGNTLVYSINSSLSANTTNSYYNGCYLYITSGIGVGQYAKVISYSVNSTVKSVLLDAPFPVPPKVGSKFEITPGVKIVGDGEQSTNAVARAIINTAGNSIHRIEMLSLGSGYKIAIANVVANPIVGVSNTAILRPIYSPPGGHGSDPAAELGATRLGFSTKFSNSDVGIPLTNDYRTIGILKDPVFANVTFEYDSGTGTFLPDEKVFRVAGIKISNTISVNSTTAIITDANADFENQLDVGEYIYFTDGYQYQLSTVNSIVNSSYITIKSNGYFDSTSSGSLYKTTIGSSVSNVAITPSTLTGNLVVNTDSTYVYGKGTDFSTDLLPNSHMFIYANSSGSGEVKLISNVVVSAYTFNANSNVDNANDFITISSHALNSNDVVLYYTSAGNTALSGLTNATYYYVVSANTTGIKLSSTRGGSAINITKGLTESGHNIKLQKLVLTSNISYTNTNAKAQKLDYTITTKSEGGIESSQGYITSVATGTFIASNVSGIFETGDMIIGEESGATGVITSISRSGVTKGFEDFVQMYKYTATPKGGTFIADELVYQSETGSVLEAHANGNLHSVVGSSPTYYYLTNHIGIFNVGSFLNGNTSKATALITNKYSPELVFESGEIVYVEKIEPITRTSTTSETMKFIFEF